MSTLVPPGWWPRLATTPSVARSKGAASARWSRPSKVPSYELPLLVGGIDLGGLYELAAELIAARGWA